MDQDARRTRLQVMLGLNRALQDRLSDHRTMLMSHHGSRERDRNLLHASKTLQRAGKMQRSLERAIRNEARQHSR